MISSSVTAPMRTAALAHGVEGVRTVGRVADGERLGDRRRLHRPHEVAPFGEGGRDRGTTLGLGSGDANVGLIVEEADVPQLVEALGDLGQLAARRDRYDDVIGRGPSEVLGHLERECLGALGVVGRTLTLTKAHSGCSEASSTQSRLTSS